MDGWINKTFFKFLLRFVIIISISIAGIIIAGSLEIYDTEPEPASVTGDQAADD